MGLSQERQRQSQGQRPSAAPAPAEQSQRRVNPEIDAKLDAYIKANRPLYEIYMARPKEDLVRKVMLQRMNKEEFANKRHENLMQWARQDPKLMAKVAEIQQRNMPADKQRTAISAVITKAAAAVQIRQGGGMAAG